MSDRRHEGRQFSQASYAFATITMPATGTGAQTGTLGKINGVLKAIDIVTTDTQDGITYTVAITNANSASLYSEGSLADNSSHRKVAVSHKNSQDADFNPQPIVDETLTLTVTPSAAPDAG
ncbi:MAG: hypothetical protein ACYTFQ_20900, partial [Planctomycetota bacterium]